MTPEDKQEVERWIDEMEKLRALSAGAPAAPVAPEGPRLEPAGSQLPAVTAPAASPQQASQVLPQVAPIQQPSPAGPVAWPPQPQPAVPVQPAPGQVFPQAPPQPPAAQPRLSLADQPVRSTSNGRGLRIAGMACGAVGLLSVATAVYYYSRATSLSDKVTHANPASTSDYQAGKDAETLQGVFYGIGAGALATGAVLYLLGYSQSATRQLSLAPILGTRITGLSAGGAF